MENKKNIYECEKENGKKQVTGREGERERESAAGERSRNEGRTELGH